MRWSNDGARRRHIAISVVAANDTLGAYLSAFAPWHAGARVPWLSLRRRAVANGAGWIQYQHPTATGSSAIASIDHAAMAFHAQQPGTSVPAPISATRATRSADVDGRGANANFCGLVTFRIDAAQNADGSGSAAYVPIRRGASKQQTNRDRRFVKHRRRFSFC